MNEPEPLIRFRCKNCGQKIRIPKIHAGKKGKCPKCKKVVIVPQTGNTTPLASQTKPDGMETGSKDNLLNPLLFDIPQKSESADQPAAQEDIPDETSEDLQKLEERVGVEQPEPVAKRKLPWPIDIFLYPTGVPGLTVLAIIIGVPLLVEIVAKLLGLFMLRLPFLFVFFVCLAIIGALIKIVIGLYTYWYFCECIRDSALGGLRAPETMATTPGIGEMLWQLIRIIGCVVFFFSPVLIYFVYTRKIDTVFWALLAGGTFFCPMGLLAVIMFDSFSALNPILIIGSIFSAFFPYFGLVLLYYALSSMTVVVIILQQKGVLPQSYFLPYVFKFISVYLLLVTAHLLGRFYWRYQEKLNWEV